MTSIHALGPLSLPCNLVLEDTDKGSETERAWGEVSNCVVESALLVAVFRTIVAAPELFAKSEPAEFVVPKSDTSRI